MRIQHNFQIILDVATVPTPDLEDPATLEDLKAKALALAGEEIDRKHGELREWAKAIRLEREKAHGNPVK